MPKRPRSSISTRDMMYKAGGAAINYAKNSARRYITAKATNYLKKAIRGKKRPITVSKTLFQRVRPVGEGSSMSYFKAGTNSRLSGRILKHIQPQRVLTIVNSNHVTSLLSQQAISDNVYNDGEQIERLFQYLTQGASASNTQRLFLASTQTDYIISNATNTNTFIKIYELVARRDGYLNSAPFLSGFGQNTPSGAFQLGVYDVTGSPDDIYTPGIKPFQAPLFCSQWKVERVYDLELGAGRSHKHSSVYKYNRFINEDYIYDGVNQTLRLRTIRGLTRAIMIIAQGSPVDDTEDHQKVTSSAVTLNIMRTSRHIIHSVDPQGTYYTIDDVRPVVTNPHFINEETGAVDTPVST